MEGEIMIKTYYRYDETGTVLDKIVVRDTWQGANRKLKLKGSKYIGVDFSKVAKAAKKWRAYLGINGLKLYLGYFETEVEAGQAYNEGVIQFYGIEGKMNDVPKPENPILDMIKIKARYNKFLKRKYETELIG